MPVFKDGRPNPRAYGQVSAGSIVGRWTGGVRGGRSRMGSCMANALVTTGLLSGVAVSTFSKTLAMVFGLLVFGVQVCRGAYGQGREGNCSCSHSIWRRRGTTSYRRRECSDMLRGSI